MVFSGVSPDGALVEIIELPDHPWFLGCQFHPEFKSRPMDPHPLFREFIRASLANANRKTAAGQALKEVGWIMVNLGVAQPLVLVAGPCVIEDESTTVAIARELSGNHRRLNLPLIFKASYDKANRTSSDSYRGPGSGKRAGPAGFYPGPLSRFRWFPMSTGEPRWNGSQGLGCLADPGLSLPPDRFAAGGRPDRSGDQYQERAVFSSLGYALSPWRK